MATTYTIRRNGKVYTATRKGTVRDGEAAGLGQGLRQRWELEELENQPKDVSFKLRCGGRMHTITLTAHGHLVLPGHKDRIIDEAISVQAALGGPRNRCKEVLAEWRNGFGGHNDLAGQSWPRRRASHKHNFGSPMTEVTQVGAYGVARKFATSDPLADGNSATRERDSTLTELQLAADSARAYRTKIAEVHWEYRITQTPSMPLVRLWGDRRMDITIGVPISWRREDTKTFPVAGTPEEFSDLPRTLDNHLVIEMLGVQKNKKDEIERYHARLLRLVTTKRGLVPVFAEAFVYKVGRGWSLSWHSPHRAPFILPDKIEFV